MLSFVFTVLVALVASDDDKGPVGVHLTTSEVAERILLAPLRGSIELVVDPLAARIQLRTTKPQPALAAQIARHAGSICPKVEIVGGAIELRCRTRRFEARLSTEGSKKFLDIQALRGLPWRDGPGGPPAYHYEPFRTGLGSVCPGSSAVARGECALLAGHQLEAATQFRAGMATNDKQMAALRLGDLALATGDPATAIGWYRRAGVAGTFGRMARTRVCEIEGSCLVSTDVVRRVFDAKGLPDPVRAEMSIRAVRAEAFTGRIDSATKMMWQMIRAGSLDWVCREGGEIVCRRVLLEAMRQAVAEPAPEVLTTTVMASAPAAAPATAPGAEAAKPTANGPDKKVEPAPAAAAAKGDASAPSSDAGAPAGVPKAPAAGLHAFAVAGKTTADRARSVTVGLVKVPAIAARPASPVAPTSEASAPDELSPAEMAIEIYLALPGWDHGVLAPELSEAAADLARHLGAPVFGGNILSAVAPEVGAAMLPMHLFKAADLYLEGDDLARAGLVIEYAHTRIGKRMSARWVALEEKIAARAASEDDAALAELPANLTIDAEAIARELAAARAARARVEPAPHKQGDKP